GRCSLTGVEVRVFSTAPYDKSDSRAFGGGFVFSCPLPGWKVTLSRISLPALFDLSRSTI
ncbi:MAG: hypothetical protein Q4G26_13490, partial [Paracoccus sp. (in: a-proteobacteria)]|nr:hypothetical protein [Paracoccus sp. (in: a-proteobacteria)]